MTTRHCYWVPVLTSLTVIHQLYHDYQTLLLGTSVNVCYWVPVLTSLLVIHQLYHDYQTLLLGTSVNVSFSNSSAIS